jgi:hypothetical protein
MNPIDLAKEI